MKKLEFDNQRELEIFLENVAFLRKTHGYSKRKMAELLCISVGTLNKIEKGFLPERLSLDVVWQTSDIFNISPSKMFVSHNEWGSI